MKRALYFWAAASVACMLVIFLSSSLNSDKSGALSGSLTRWIAGIVEHWFKPEGQKTSEAALDTGETVLRKCAHFFIYLILGFCTINTVRRLTAYKWRAFWIPLCWCTVYAASDEWHQSFVPGRSPMVRDWLIDTAGALAGIGAVFLITWMKQRKLKVKQ